MAISTQPQVIPLWPNGAPGSETWTQVERQAVVPDSGMHVVWNVTQPTLTAYLPRPEVATGTAVVVAPGGAYHFLAIKHEGTDVAEWLAERGIAAFILRYRLIRTSDDVAQMRQETQKNLSDRERMRDLMLGLRPMIVADGQQAIRLVRERAAEWDARVERVGIVGFSAGGGVTTGVALEHDAASRPDFVAPIYPAPWDSITVPADAAPMFLALASDDDMAVRSSHALFSAWREAGVPVELHVFAKGGHGFGMRKQGLPSDRWIELFADWLRGQGLL
jgi:acetyl esterase/lipase